MTDLTTLSLDFGLDKALAWREGGSVRHAVAELRAAGPARRTAPPPLNLALAIDVSGSMAGPKIEAARRTALAVVEALGPRDRLTLVAFDNRAERLLAARPMDGEGRTAAAAAVRRLADRGGTNLWEGWCSAAEEVATAMQQDPRASHRVLLLSDGQANEGITDPAELARHTRALLERGIVTSAVGIGDGYDEAVLGGMAEAGGGRLHDAEHAREIAEVVLGELMEGRSALLERTTLRIAVPAGLRAELVGPWTHTAVPGGLEVLVGTLLPEVPVRIVVRLHAPAGEAGATFRIGATAEGSLPDGAGTVAAAPADCALTLARSAENNAQARDEARAVAVMTAWQSQAIRQALAMNRDADRRGAKHYLERELRFLERYARGLPGAEGILAELVLLLRRAEEELDPRLRKELYATTVLRSFSRADHRSAPRAPLADLLRRDEA